MTKKIKKLAFLAVCSVFIYSSVCASEMPSRDYISEINKINEDSENTVYDQDPENDEIDSFFIDETDEKRRIVRPEIVNRSRFQIICMQVGLQTFMVADNLYKKIRNCWRSLMAFFGYKATHASLLSVQEKIEEENSIQSEVIL